MRRRGLAWPLILISGGLLFLLSNLGLIPWSAWALVARFWPLILILIGLDILLGRTWVGSVVFLGIVILIALGLALAALYWRYPLPAVESEQLVQELEGLERAEVDLDFEAGELIVESLPPDSPSLMEGWFQHGRRMEVIKSFQASEGEGKLRLEGRGRRVFFFPPFHGGQGRWEVQLTRRIPLDLRVETGVGETHLDLRELRVTRLDLDAGVGDVQVTFPSEAGLTTAKVDSGVGSLTLDIPSQVAARIRVDSGLGSLSIDQERFPRSGEVYASEDFATAENRLELDIDIGVGEVTIR